jgi:hypothetical protein
LDNYVNELYSKKKISNIKLKGLGNGEYEFGTQKIKIIMESDVFKGISLLIQLKMDTLSYLLVSTLNQMQIQKNSRA